MRATPVYTRPVVPARTAPAPTPAAFQVQARSFMDEYRLNDPSSWSSPASSRPVAQAAASAIYQASSFAPAPVYASASGPAPRSGGGFSLPAGLFRSTNPTAFKDAYDSAFSQGDTLGLSVASPDAIERAMEAMQSDQRSILDIIRGTPVPRARFDNASITLEMPQVDFTGGEAEAAKSRLFLWLALAAAGGLLWWKKPWSGKGKKS